MPKPKFGTLSNDLGGQDERWGNNDMDVTGGEKNATFDVATMDREHAGQLSMFNDLKNAVRSGADDSLVYALLDELVEHSNLHFLSEQLAMKLHAYESYESHLLEHERLMAEIHKLKDGLATGTPADKHSLIEALRGWLVVHIQTADQQLAEYLRKRAPTQEPEL